MSEISTYVSSGPSVPRKPGAVGKAQPGRRVAVLPLDGGNEPLPSGEEGLLAVHRSDPGLMLGYWQRPQEEELVYRGDWFVGGDLAVIDPEGYVSHRGRANDLMKALGYRVSPLEVEAALAEHPVNCRGRVRRGARARRRQRHRRVRRAHAGAPADAADIERFAAERLAAYKRPRSIVFVDALPRTANGKLKRQALRLPDGLSTS